MKCKILPFLVILGFSTSSPLECTEFTWSERVYRLERLKWIIVSNKKTVYLATAGICGGLNTFSTAESIPTSDVQTFCSSVFIVLYYFYLANQGVSSEKAYNAF